jgi:hypothetical protein
VYTHISIVVKFEGRRYLLDTGFGEGSPYPIIIEEDVISGGEGVSLDGYRYKQYRSTEFPGHWYYERVSAGLPGLGGVVNAVGVWEKRILWRDQPALLKNVVYGCQWVQGDNGNYSKIYIVVLLYFFMHLVCSCILIIHLSRRLSL